MVLEVLGGTIDLSWLFQMPGLRLNQFSDEDTSLIPMLKVGGIRICEKFIVHQNDALCHVSKSAQTFSAKKSLGFIRKHHKHQIVRNIDSLNHWSCSALEGAYSKH